MHRFVASSLYMFFLKKNLKSMFVSWARWCVVFDRDDWVI